MAQDAPAPKSRPAFDQETFPRRSPPLDAWRVPSIPSIPPTPLGTPPFEWKKALKAAKESPGHRWRHQEVQNIPYNNMFLVFSGLMLMTFLAALDQTVAAIALPTIVDDIGGESGYSWVGTAYMLMAVCVAPINGKLSDIIGRKPILFSSIFLFLVGSALCGAAQNFLWLALCRGLQGMGAGGIMQMTTIIVSDITSLDERPVYDSLIEATYGFASVIGPFVGGALTQHVSWRWCFWINIPTGVIAMLLLLLFLNLNSTEKRSVRSVSASFDFKGLFLLTGGVALLLIGFQGAQTAKNGWRSAQTIAPLVSGVVLLVLTIFNELLTSRDSIIPVRVFKTRTTIGIMIGGFIHYLTFFSATYYAPLYFQILGSSATMAGIKMLPLSFGSAFVSIFAGLIISKTLRFRPFLWVGFAIMTLGYGLMIMLDERTSTVKQELWLLVAGIGIGCLFQPPLIGLTAAMQVKDMATTLSVFNLLTSLGGTIGISIGDTIFSTELAKRLSRIPGASGLGTTSGITGFTRLTQIQPESLRDEVLHAYTRSLSTIWLVFCPLAFVGLLAVLPVREYKLDRKTNRDLENPAQEEAGALADFSGYPSQPGKAPETADLESAYPAESSAQPRKEAEQLDQSICRISGNTSQKPDAPGYFAEPASGQHRALT